VFPEKQVGAIRDTILGLENVDDASKLARLLVKTA